MNQKQITMIKTLVDKIGECVETVASKFDVDDPGSAGEAFKFELAMFMMYLSASDGELKWEEAQSIGQICGFQMTPQKMSEIIGEQNIYSTEFENRVPVTFQMMIAGEKALYEAGTPEDIAPIVIDAYRSVGTALIQADNDENESEREDFNIYINMLERYANENSPGRRNTVTGFRKNGENISAPGKSGVRAPKKG